MQARLVMLATLFSTLCCRAEEMPAPWTPQSSGVAYNLGGDAKSSQGWSVILHCGPKGFTATLLTRYPMTGEGVAAVLAKTPTLKTPVPLLPREDRYLPGVVSLGGLDGLEGELVASETLDLKVSTSMGDEIAHFSFTGLRASGPAVQKACPAF